MPRRWIAALRLVRIKIGATYRQLVMHSGLPGARNPLLFTTFLVREIGRKQASTRAMALSFQLLFCLVPALTLVTSLFAMLPGLAPARQRFTAFLLDEFLPTDRDLMLEQIERFMSNAEVFSAVGVAVLVYGTALLVMTLNRTLNAVWNIRLTRVTWWQRLGSLGMVGVLFLVGLGTGIITSAPFQTVLRLLDRAPLVSPGVRSFMTGVGIGWLVCFALYKLVPSTWVRTSSAAMAALAASLLLSLGKVAFLSFAGWSTAYTRIYGVIGALFMTLLWVYVAWLIVLSGAVMAFVLQNYEHLAGQEQEKMLGERYQAYFATRILLAVYRAQAAGCSPVSIVELAEELGMPVYLADRLADTMSTRGLLRQVGTSRWSQLEPTLPPDAVTVARIIGAVSSDPLDVPRDADETDPTSRALVSVLRRTRVDVTRTLGDTSLAALLSAE